MTDGQGMHRTWVARPARPARPGRPGGEAVSRAGGEAVSRAGGDMGIRQQTQPAPGGGQDDQAQGGAG
jgi:hypothetical protein